LVVCRLDQPANAEIIYYSFQLLHLVLQAIEPGRGGRQRREKVGEEKKGRRKEGAGGGGGERERERE